MYRFKHILETLLLEGGAVGHLQHLFDDRTLTFSDFKEIVNLSIEGKLESASEKLDGMNIVFTWLHRDQEPMFARNNGDILKGGMSIDQLSEKFSGRGSIQNAFTEAANVIKEAVITVPRSQQLLVFGDNVNEQIWYSVEIVYPENPNVINYDGNSLVFHAWPSFKQDIKTKHVAQYVNEEGVDTLTSNIETMQAAIKELNWKIRAPIMMQLKKISDQSFLQSVLNDVDSLLKTYGLSDENTINDYMYEAVCELALQHGISHAALDAVVKKILGDPKAVNVNVLKKQFAAEFDDIKQLLDKSKETVYEAIKPLEKITHKLAVKVLTGMYSMLIANPQEETSRLKKEVKNAITALRSTNDPKLLYMLQKQLAKLGDVLDEIIPLEGIVFIYKGKAFKFTGTFAPVNQILGILRYNRINLSMDQ